MAKSFPVGFRIHIPEPVEVKMVSPTISVRNAISPFERFKGLFTYVVEEDTFYYLSEGVTNNHWKPIGKPTAVEILDTWSDQPQKIISGHGLKAYLEANYVTKQELKQAIEAVKVPNHVKGITQQQINKWENLKSDKHKIHIQTTASMTWVMNHQLGKEPTIQAFLNDKTEILANVSHIDQNISVLKFSKPQVGYATFN